MPAGTARPSTSRRSASRAGYSCGIALLMVLFGCRGLQNAVAEGETRTISMHHVHTDESITITYKRDGRYDEAALEKLNWFLRDWRRSKETRMDPQLIDLLWEVQRETGSKEPIDVVCGYRAPETNAMLRRRSRGVARLSQHILGHAVDFYIPGVPLEQLRVIGLRLQRGGVGFYPTSGSPFVHMDTGGVRMWPRMTREQLLHVFPDGRTVYLPTDGRPLSGYTLALADLKKRGQNPSETWAEEANDEGLSENIVLAGDEHQHAGSSANLHAKTLPKGETAGHAALRTAVATPVAPAPTAATPAAAPRKPAAPVAGSQPMNALLAALEREAERRRSEAGSAVATSSSPGDALYHTASFTEPSTGSAPPQIAASMPSQTRTSAARRALAASVADATGTITPSPHELALGYAAQEGPEAAPATPVTTTMAAAQDQAPPPTAITIAVKRTANQVASTIVGAHPRLASSAKEGAQFDDPWLDAMMVSPSVRRYLTAFMLGAEDYVALASLMQKPASSVIMTFAADPNPGLTHDHFSGSAVMFVSTVSYATHTASLR